MKPKIRLKGFEGEWENKKLEEITTDIYQPQTISQTQFSSQGYPVYGANGIIGFYDSYNHETEQILVTCRGASCGTINLSEGKCWITGNAMVINLDKVSDLFEKRFFYYLLSHIDLSFIVTGSGQPQIVRAPLLKLDMSFPSLPEQQSIATYFKSLDALIQSSTKKVAQLKQLKAASLISMFPQEGETKPKVRFKGFEGEWQKTKLGALFNERLESNIYGEMLSVTMNQGIIKAFQNGRHDNSNADKSHYKVVKVNDIAYNSMRMWQGASGYSPYEGIVSPAYTVVTPNEGIDSLFFSYYFKTQNLIKVFRLNSQGLTSDTWNLKYPAFSRIEILYPKDLTEQQCIASYFQNVDTQIRLQEQRLEKLKQIKAACLEQMFV